MKHRKDAAISRQGNISRRDFIAGTAAAAAFTIVPRHVLAGSGQTPPSEKLNIAGIGIGGQGKLNVKNVSTENIVALCDVDWGFVAKTFELYPKAKKYRDFRKMFDKQKDIDAVVIATPDHNHAIATMAALQLGKHVFCEKPLTHSIYEARKITETARQVKVTTQMGIQAHSCEGIRLACEWIWAGAIGPVREVHAWTSRPSPYWWPYGKERPKETPPVPETLDWNLWLGPAPYRPYHPCYLPAKWRGWRDFGTGAIGDMGAHILDPVFWALKLCHPTTVEASFARSNDDTYPWASIIHYEFPAREDMPPLKLTWYDGGLMPPRPDELEPGRRMGNSDGGVLYIGEKGKILAGYAEGPRLIPETKMKEYKRPPKTIPRVFQDTYYDEATKYEVLYIDEHKLNWLQSCKAGKQASAGFDYSGPLTEIVLLGNLAINTGEKLHWDGPNMKVKNLPEADKYINLPYNHGWTL
jgi:predicted dehydrogenase